jgi:hypothetical protein
MMDQQPLQDSHLPAAATLDRGEARPLNESSTPLPGEKEGDHTADGATPDTRDPAEGDEILKMQSSYDR